uniref:Microtubule associated scaffold protein 2 n=1 Tax=Equus caballus TaxID=9796 RepID=A0A9L0S6A8_HORSE
MKRPSLPPTANLQETWGSDARGTARLLLTSKGRRKGLPDHLCLLLPSETQANCFCEKMLTTPALGRSCLDSWAEDQVDTLTFQSQSLRDRARRFEEALRKNTEEQLEIALAPYQHLEEDMKSLKQVLEMKNQQIHQQEKKIIELEKLAEKNIILEEKIQVLQQQNEDLKARIDQNTVVTRQLSEENANLQEYVEKETQEKKRLSRTNEELLWKLQTGDPTSPVKLSPTSPVYRGSSSGPSSPARVSTTPR